MRAFLSRALAPRAPLGLTGIALGSPEVGLVGPLRWLHIDSSTLKQPGLRPRSRQEREAELARTAALLGAESAPRPEAATNAIPDAPSPAATERSGSSRRVVSSLRAARPRVLQPGPSAAGTSAAAAGEAYFERVVPLARARLPVAPPSLHARAGGAEGGGDAGDAEPSSAAAAEVAATAIAHERREKSVRLNKQVRRRTAQSLMETATSSSSSSSSPAPSSSHERGLERLDMRAEAQRAYPWRVPEERFFFSPAGAGAGAAAGMGLGVDGVAAAPLGEVVGAREGGEAAVNWFPGHMAKAVVEMRERLRHVHVVLEMRDARIPFASANPLLDDVTRGKPRVVVFNKADLAGPAAIARALPAIVRAFNLTAGSAAAAHKAAAAAAAGGPAPAPLFATRARPGLALAGTKASGLGGGGGGGGGGGPAGMIREVSSDGTVAFVFASATSPEFVSGVLDLVKRVAPPRKFKVVPTSVLVCGYPNVGKSTLINSLRASSKRTGAFEDGFQLSPLAGVATAAAFVPSSPAAAAAAGRGGRSVKGGGGGGGGGRGEVYLQEARGAKAKTGAEPGVTRRIDGFKVSSDPPIVVSAGECLLARWLIEFVSRSFAHHCITPPRAPPSPPPSPQVLDSPGIMTPRLQSPTVAMRLAVTGAIADRITGLDSVCGYLLHALNRTRQLTYVRRARLPDGKPTTNLRFLLYHLARAEGMTDAGQRRWAAAIESDAPHLLRADRRAKQQGGEDAHTLAISSMSVEHEERMMAHFLKLYRAGELGPAILDILD